MTDPLLAGVRVVDLTEVGLGYAGRTLADLGADVIMVEPPGGSAERQPPPGPGQLPVEAAFAFMGAGKRSMTLNLDHDEGRALLERLLGTSDVLVTSRPGALEQAGLGSERLASTCPRLIFAAVTPFGISGPRSEWKGSDLIAWASSGVLPMVGDPDRAPLVPREGLAYFAGAINVVMGVILALEARDISGGGQVVDVSLQEAVLSVTLEATPALALDNGATTVRAGKRRQTPPQGHYRAKDGAVSIVAFTPWQWDALAGWIRDETGNERVTDDTYKGTPADRSLFRDDLNRWIEDMTTLHTKQDLAEEAQRRGIPVMPVNTTDDVNRDPHLAATRAWTSVTVPGASSVRLPAAPLQVDGSRLDAGPVPGPGAHTEEILAEFGLRQGDIRRLRSIGAV